MDIDIINQNLSKSNLDRLKNQSSKFDADRLDADKLKEQELKDACEGFEAIFLHSMIKSMRDTLPGDALFKDSHGMDMYKSMYDQHLADELSTSQTSIGVKEFLYNQLKDSV